MNKASRNFLFGVILLLYGCGTPATETAIQNLSDSEVIFQGNTQTEVVQTLTIDNCDGKSDLSRTEERSQSVDVTLSAEVAAKMGASVEVISAEAQAAVDAATTQSGSRSMSIQLTAPPKTHMQFQLIWTGNEQIGVIQNLRGANMPIAFRGFAPTDVRIKSQNDIGCPNSEVIQEVVEAQPTSQPQVSVLPSNCDGMSWESCWQIDDNTQTITWIGFANGITDIAQDGLALQKIKAGYTAIITIDVAMTINICTGTIDGVKPSGTCPKIIPISAGTHRIISPGESGGFRIYP